MQALAGWVHGLGKELSIQPAYNLPLDMAGIIILKMYPSYLILCAEVRAARAGKTDSLPGFRKTGWSYSSISGRFADASAHVVGGILSPMGPARRSILIESGENITVSGLRSLNEWTRAELPVLFVSGNPGDFLLKNDTREYFEQKLSKLMVFKNVYLTDGPNSITEQLVATSISPHVSARTNGIFYSIWYDAGATSSTATLSRQRVNSQSSPITTLTSLILSSSFSIFN